ncbi:transporter substrate-binding domain-containing protein [Sneathiella sp. P13V-1]|uniref:transporter substrate-binding domain-containing protein n=1 Tax=Sneathiella sp. P13V-1 TaxID=2697366 RepID=UPI00187B2FCE|nr:transporter substrate-binding domain-containing protein [Sneathiella sp. P13V-1]MBE7636598.1 transporter substrate-binding domain-containing protein [Sneathiella sp. P13V-1]
MMKSFLLLCVAWITFAVFPKNAQAIEIVTSHYPPLTNQHTDDGIINRLILKAAKEVGLDVTFTYQPFNRLTKVWNEKDKLLLHPSSAFSDKRVTGFLFRSVFRSGISIMYKSSTSIPPSLQLTGINVGSVAFNALEVGIGERLGVTMSSYPTMDSGIKMLKADRIDAVFCASIVCEYFKNENQDVTFSSRHIETISIDLFLVKGSEEHSVECYEKLAAAIRRQEIGIETLLPATEAH